jgi:hypothetical protein
MPSQPFPVVVFVEMMHERLHTQHPTDWLTFGYNTETQCMCHYSVKLLMMLPTTVVLATGPLQRVSGCTALPTCVMKAI